MKYKKKQRKKVRQKMNSAAAEIKQRLYLGGEKVLSTKMRLQHGNSITIYIYILNNSLKYQCEWYTVIVTPP